MTSTTPLPAAGSDGIDAGRLFTGSRFAIATGAARFVAITTIMDSLKNVFGLSDEDVGWIGGAGLWGFTVPMLIFGSLCDVLGMKLVLRLAVLCHLAGALLMIFAGGFWTLFAGSLLLSMGDCLVQAACNPLVATLYPDRKTEMFNKLHLWFPGGIVITGLVAYGLTQIVPAYWQAELVVVLIPAVGYGVLFLGQQFPATERVQSGVSSREMFRETFCRPLFWVLALAMMMTASVELGPNTWLTPMLASGGIPGILVLVWISLLMAVMRQLSGTMLRTLGATRILLLSAVLTGLGLLWLSYAHSLVIALAAGSLFALGVAYFWPTMIGTTSERVPKGGALALAMMGAAGMLSVGLITTPMMGRVADQHFHSGLPVAETQACLRQIVETFPQLAERGASQPVEKARLAAADALRSQTAPGTLAVGATADALRLAIAADSQAAAAKEAKLLWRQAEYYGRQVAFRYVAVLAVALMAIFGLLHLRGNKGDGSVPSSPEIG